MDGLKLIIALGIVWIFHVWVTISTMNTHHQHGPPPGGSFSAPSAHSRSASSSDSNSYWLASSQSEGFFDDISNAHWKIAQKYHAAMFPNFYHDLARYSHGAGDKKDWSKLRQANLWYGDNFQVEFICPLARRMPSTSMADGPKWVRILFVRLLVGGLHRLLSYGTNRPPPPSLSLMCISFPNYRQHRRFCVRKRFATRTK